MLRAGKLLLTASSLLTASLAVAAGPVRVNGSTTVNPIVVEAAEALRAGRGMTIHVDTQGGRSLPRREWPERIERALREAALWEETGHRLRESAASLSVGQQQRLCLARALAGEPEVILLDEPTSALDAGSTAAIEDLILRLRERHSIVLVTHNLRQARRVADSLACLCVREQAGEVVESGLCGEIFESPRSPELVRYISQESK